MRALLALMLALFALTAAVPAAAAHGNCPMAEQAMQGMDMATGKDGSQDPCCQHADKACAAACATVCSATMMAPAGFAEISFVAVHASVASATQRQLPLANPGRIDPPPKPAARA